MRRAMFVLDASVTSGWLIDSQQTPYKEAALAALIQHQAMALVPALWHLEVANFIMLRIKRDLLPIDKAHLLAQYAERLPVTTDELSWNTLAWKQNLKISKLFELAAINQLTTYDGAYLALALRSGLPLATADKALIAAAQHMGVQIFGSM